MRILFGPWQVGALIAAVIGAVSGSVPMVLAGLTAWFAISAYRAVREGARSPSGASVELSPDSRIAVRPLRDQIQEIERLLERVSDNSTVRLMGAEALSEARSLLASCERTLAARDGMRLLMRGESEAQAAIRRLDDQIATASDAERPALASARKAHEGALAEYATASERLREVDDRIREAHASVAGLRAKLTAAATAEHLEAPEQAELSAMIENLKGVSRAMDETQGLFQEQRR